MSSSANPDTIHWNPATVMDHFAFAEPKPGFGTLTNTCMSPQERDRFYACMQEQTYQMAVQNSQLIDSQVREAARKFDVKTQHQLLNELGLQREKQRQLEQLIHTAQKAAQPAPSRQGIRLPTKEQAAQAAMIVADDGAAPSRQDPLGMIDRHPHARNMCECGVFVPIIDRIVQAGLCRTCWMEQDFELSQDFRCIDLENALAAVDRQQHKSLLPWASR